jgi:AraC-like DNA-binding protein
MFFERFRLDNDFMFERKIGNCLEHELHFHEVLELHVLQINEARFRLAHREYEGKPGDVFLFRPFEPHWNLMKEPGKSIEWISVLFYPSVVRAVPGGAKLLAPFYAVEAVSPYIPASSLEALEIQRLAAEAVEEERIRGIGWEAKQFQCMIHILIHILRYAAKHHLPATEDHFDNGVLQAIEYMLGHYTQQVDVDQLVDGSGRKRTAFYESFKAITSLTPNQFIHRLRVQAAVYMLQTTDRKVTDIAFDCGYLSLESFDKQFRQQRGMSPRAFRTICRQAES